MLEGSGEGREREDSLWVEIAGKIDYFIITFKCFFNVDKFLTFRILPIKCIVTYFTDIMIHLNPMQVWTFTSWGKKKVICLGLRFSEDDELEQNFSEPIATPWNCIS